MTSETWKEEIRGILDASSIPIDYEEDGTLYSSRHISTLHKMSDILQRAEKLGVDGLYIQMFEFENPPENFPTVNGCRLRVAFSKCPIEETKQQKYTAVLDGVRVYPPSEKVMKVL